MTVALRIDNRIINRVDQIAESQGLNRSTYIRNAIIEKLEEDMDIAAALEVKANSKENDTVSWNEVREKYGLAPKIKEKGRKAA